MFERLHNQAEQYQAQRAQMAAEQAFAELTPELVAIKAPGELMDENIEWVNSLSNDLEHTGIQDVFNEFKAAMDVLHEKSAVTLNVKPFKWISDGVITSSEMERCATQRMSMLRALAGYCLELKVEDMAPLRSDEHLGGSGMLLYQELNIIASQTTMGSQKPMPKCAVLPGYRRIYMPHFLSANGDVRMVSGGPTLSGIFAATTAVGSDHLSKDSIGVNYDLYVAQGMTYAAQTSEYFQHRARKKLGRIDPLSLYDRSGAGERAYSLRALHDRKIAAKDLVSGVIAGPFVADSCTLDVSSQLATQNTRELIADKLEKAVIEYKSHSEF